MVGWLVEVIGVNTGLLFGGGYQYGSVFGVQVLRTPLLIGINWSMLSIAIWTGLNANFPGGSRWLCIIVGASLMVGLDFIIEPVAIALDFWTWSGHIPSRNYIDWFVISALMFYLASRLMPHAKNNIGTVLFILQLLFFVLLSVS